jgi:hypothetical protein
LGSEAWAARYCSKIAKKSCYREIRHREVIREAEEFTGNGWQAYHTYVIIGVIIGTYPQKMNAGYGVAG